MSIAASIGTYLNSYAPLSALVGTRIYPGRATDNETRPYVVYSLKIVPINPLASPSPINECELKITVVSANYDEAHTIAEDAVLPAFNYFRGVMGSGKDVTGCIVESLEDQEASEFGLYEVLISVRIHYTP